MLRQGGLALLVLAGWAGCAEGLGQTDNFAEKLRQGCRDERSCEQLQAEAERRHDGCAENTIGRLRCSDTKADLRESQRLLRYHREAREKRDEEVRGAQAEERTKRMHREYEERQKKREAERDKRETEREKDRILVETEAAARKRAALVADAKTVGKKGRALQLKECHAAGKTCWDDVVVLMEAAEDENEKDTLITLHERLTKEREAREKKEAAAEESRSPRSVKCCDGTLSPSCVCGGRLRGCCSHHGGVCGCE